MSGMRSLVLCFLVILLTGCSDENSNVLRLSGWVSSPQESDLTQELVDKFSEKHPQHQVDYSPIQANYIEKIQLMLGTGTAPDVFMLEAFWAPSLISFGTLSPLDELISQESEFDISDFEPALLEAFRADDKLYGLPKDYSTLVLFYNPEMFAAAGLSGPPKDWTELLEYAKKLTVDTDGDGRIDQYGFGLVDGLEYVLPFIWQNGSDLLTEDGKLNVDDPKFREALAYLQNLRRSDTAKLPSEVGAAWNMDGYGRQRIAMTMSGVWALNFLDETFPDTPYEVAYLPRGREQKTIAFVVGYVIPQDVADKESAWDLLRFLTSRDGQSIAAELNVALPPRKSVAEENRADFPDVFAESTEFSRTWQVGKDQRLMDEIQTTMQSIFIADTDVDVALENLKRRLRYQE